MSTKRTAEVALSKEEPVADTVSSVAGASSQNQEEEELECQNCNERYYESKNGNDNACMWYSRTHKGQYLCDYESEFWYGWHEAKHPKKSSYWKEQGDGGQKWTICGCTHASDECERTQRHKPTGSPLSDDDMEDEDSKDCSDDEFEGMDEWKKVYHDNGEPRCRKISRREARDMY
jgi:hypothetical protein